MRTNAAGRKNSTTRFKSYPGGGCRLASANASADLQSSSIARYWGDEVGEYPAEAGSRGAPVDQAKKAHGSLGPAVQIFADLDLPIRPFLPDQHRNMKNPIAANITSPAPIAMIISAWNLII